MIYTSEKGIIFIMIAFLLSVFIFVIYFMGETKKIENLYDDILLEANLPLG